MNNYSPKDLIKLYYKQLTVGCECGECQNECCKTSKRFSLSFENPNQAAVEAIRMTLLHPAHSRLCENLALDINFGRTTKENIFNFNHMLGKMIRHELDTPEIKYKAKTALENMFQDHEGFPYVLMTRYDDTEKSDQDQSITYYHINPHIKDLLLNEAVVCDIPLALAHYQHELRLLDLSISFNNLVNDIIVNDPPNTARHVRLLMMFLCMNIYFQSENGFENILIPLLKHIMTLQHWAYEYFVSCLSLYPSLLRSLLGPLKEHVVATLQKLEEQNISIYNYDEHLVFLFGVSIRFINILFEVNNHIIDPIPVKEFYIPTIIPRLEPDIEIQRFTIVNERGNPNFIDEYIEIDDETQFAILSLLNYPCVIPFDFKVAVFYSMWSQQVGQTVSKFNILVNRDSIAQDTIECLRLAGPMQLRSVPRVAFRGEKGIDMGGLTREFFYLSVTRLFSDYSFFKIVNDRVFWFPDVTFETNQDYALLGSLVAMSFVNKVAIPIRFPILMYKKLLDKPLSINDLYELDESVAKSLLQLIEYRNTNQSIEDLALTFSLNVDIFGKNELILLRNNGDKIPVTNDNLDEYIQDYVNYKLDTSVKAQFDCFAQGFRMICPLNMYSIFTPEELDMMISGESNYDWNLLQLQSEYQGFEAHKNVIQWFWTIFLKEFTEEQRKQLLLFITGSDRAPVGGFKEMKLKFRLSPGSNLPPTSHTCFNMIDLSDYSSQQELRKALQVALDNSTGFGLA